MAPNKAIRTAPPATKSVPSIENLVKGSSSIRVAQAVLKTKPDACRVDRTGKGKVVICMVLPTMFETKNMNIPICHRRRR